MLSVQDILSAYSLNETDLKFDIREKLKIHYASECIEMTIIQLSTVTCGLIDQS